MFGAEIDKGITLVVPQQHVVARPMRLDQVVFQDQRFGFGIGHGYVDRSHLPHQRPGLRCQAAAAEIAGHALLQIARLADVQQLARFVQHAVYTRPRGQGAQKGFTVELSTGFSDRHWTNERLRGGVEKFSGTPDDVAEHRFRQPPGLGVIATAVIGIKQRQIAQSVLCAVREAMRATVAPRNDRSTASCAILPSASTRPPAGTLASSAL